MLIESNLRDNIDPLDIYTYKEILNIINDLCLFKNITDENKKLNFEIKENGKNLSSGEKKLICFARTIIKKIKYQKKFYPVSKFFAVHPHINV